MKRVLLVNPNTERAPYPVAPVGLCLIAASLEGRYEVRVYDGTFEGAEALPDVLKGFAPDYVGIGIRNIDDVTLGSERYYIDDIRRDYVTPIRRASRAPVILGGAGYNMFPRLLLKALEADFGVAGEGERCFPELLDALETGGDPSNIAGVVTPSGDVSFARSEGTLSIPNAAVDVRVDFEPYRGRGTYPVQTKRGCHLRCVYCSYPIIEGRRYRLRPPEDIVDEVASAAARLGEVVFEFVDSTFNAPTGHAEAICDEIVRRNLRLRLRSMGLNPGGITRRLLEKMQAAGFVQIVCSADTASPAMLERLGKGFTREDLETVAGLLRELDIPTMWSFIFGGPGETEATLEESFDFIERFVAALDMVHMTEGIRVYPDTPIHARAVAEGVVSKDDTLLLPVFYVSPALGRERLGAIIRRKSEFHPNCIRNLDSSPPPEMLKRAMALRQREGLDEPMFRTLLRIRRGDG